MISRIAPTINKAKRFRLNRNRRQRARDPLPFHTIFFLPESKASFQPASEDASLSNAQAYKSGPRRQVSLMILYMSHTAA